MQIMITYLIGIIFIACQFNAAATFNIDTSGVPKKVNVNPFQTADSWSFNSPLMAQHWTVCVLESRGNWIQLSKRGPWIWLLVCDADFFRIKSSEVAMAMKTLPTPMAIAKNCRNLKCLTIWRKR